VKCHLRDGGILQQWLPSGDATTTASVARALAESFPYVRAFGSVEGWGTHFLASMTPIPQLPAPELAAKLPTSAATNLMEWGPASTPETQFTVVLNSEKSITELINKDPHAPALQDDEPVNEYFMLRRLSDPLIKEELVRRFLGRSQQF
jgi:hypothetical protein